MVTLLVHHNEAVAVASLTAAMLDAFGHWENLVPTPGNAKTAMAGLNWLAVLYKAMDAKAVEAVGKKMMRMLSGEEFTNRCFD
jgi:hypothetical protein